MTSHPIRSNPRNSASEVAGTATCNKIGKYGSIAAVIGWLGGVGFVMSTQQHKSSLATRILIVLAFGAAASLSMAAIILFRQRYCSPDTDSTNNRNILGAPDSQTRLIPAPGASLGQQHTTVTINSDHQTEMPPHDDSLAQPHTTRSNYAHVLIDPNQEVASASGSPRGT